MQLKKIVIGGFIERSNRRASKVVTKRYEGLWLESRSFLDARLAARIERLHSARGELRDRIIAADQFS
jgi:hypothetical protein